MHVHFLKYNEEYIAQIPNGYVRYVVIIVVRISIYTLACVYRSILTIPWFEFGGECPISCKQSGYSANVEFHTKVLCIFQSLYSSLCSLRAVVILEKNYG